MKKIRIFFKVLVIIIVLLAVAITVAVYRLKPEYSGSTKLKGLDHESTVYFDDYGVPHIYAASAKDAMISLGYVHAQDRLWQMELLRRIAPGRLSELFGNVTLKNDKFFAGLGIEEASADAIARLDTNSAAYKLSEAYLEGINQFIEKGPTPVEFYLLGIKKNRFELKDIYNIFGYMSFSFAMAQKTDPLLSEIQDKLGANYIKELGVEPDNMRTIIHNAKEKNQGYAEIASSIDEILQQSPVPPFIGSNSWVIGPAKTKNGKVIFANDPHIAFSQPSVWYEAHTNYPGYEMYGYYLAGVPFPLLGHNHRYAFGLTMFENDDIDFYREEDDSSNPNKYKTPSGWKEYEVKKKTIKVKNEKDVELTVKLSRHGPIVNDLIEGISQKEPLAMSWIYTHEPVRVLEAVYQISHASNMESFKQGVSLIAAPGLNVMYGDSNGNIGWWATGKLYKIGSAANRNFLLNGSEGKDDISTFLSFSENPSAVNPSWKYVYSANNQPDSIDGFLYPGYYVPEDRAKRIVGLLEPRNDWDSKAVASMITDVTSSVAPDIIRELIKVVDISKLTLNERKALSILKEWNGAYDLNRTAPTIYTKWVYRYLKNTFEDELGEKNFQRLLSTHLIKTAFEKQIKNEESVWWDDVNTPNVKETKQDILTRSLQESITALEKQLGGDIDTWTWNRVNTLEHQHPLGKVAALRKYFDVGPFPVMGGPEVINNMMSGFTNDGEYHVVAGPSTRRVIDFSDIESSMSVLPTGQSGNPFSSHYKDQASMYINGQFRKMKLNKEEIIKTSTRLLLKKAD